MTKMVFEKNAPVSSHHEFENRIINILEKV